jgi:3-hydroxyacyl-CoA dehydrogenase
VAGSATGKGGTMGAGNAIVAVRAGFPTIAYDVETTELADLSACDLVIEPFSRTSRPSRSCSAP